MGGILPVPGQTIYGASKAAVTLLTEGLSAELANTNVHVTVIFPDMPGAGSNEQQPSIQPLAPSKAAQQNEPFAYGASRFGADGCAAPFLVGKERSGHGYSRCNW